MKTKTLYAKMLEAENTAGSCQVAGMGVGPEGSVAVTTGSQKSYAKKNSAIEKMLIKFMRMKTPS